jgi:hypothetical protein
MKSFTALFAGLLFILAALVLALQTTSQDNAPRPVEARALATEFHSTPSPTATRTVTATSTPLARHVTTLDPADDELLALLFTYPSQGIKVGTRNARLDTSHFSLDDGTSGLLVTGTRLEGGRGRQVGSGAFGSILIWENGEYVPRFLRVVWSRGYVLVSASESRGEVVLNFEPLMGSAGQVGWQRTIDLFPCAASRGTPTAPAVASTSDVEHRCY